MSCYLRISGSFDPALIAEASRLPNAEMWKQGEPNYHGNPYRSPHRNSGIQLQISAANYDDWDGQLNEATAFLALHRATIRAITNRDDVTDAFVDFGLAQERRYPAFYIRITSEFVCFAAQAGLEIGFSYYAVSGLGGFPDEDSNS